MSAIGLGHQVARGRDVVFRVLDGEAVLVELATGTYFGLDPVGTFIWERAERGARVDSILEALLEEYEVPRETAARDLLRLLGALEGKRLLRVTGGPPAAGSRR